MNEVKITMTKGTPCVSSLQVAEDFGKRNQDMQRKEKFAWIQM